MSMEREILGWKFFLLFLSILYVVSSKDFPQQESPTKIKDGCKNCETKVEGDTDFFCCTDCTYPDMVYGDTPLGYCPSGAELISQPKPKEVFEWVAGQWWPCSAPCGSGIRIRRVECFAVIEETSLPDYPVYDDHCFNLEKPIVKEHCNIQNCIAEVVARSKKDQERHGRAWTWMITIFIFLGVIVAFAFASFAFAKRRTSTHTGYVYIMMEGFSQ